MHDWSALFVGREMELETLRARLLRARDGFGSVVALVGEAGAGKTTVARAFAAYARGEGACVAWGACVEGESSAPFGPWASALSDMVARVGVRKAARAVGAARGAVGCFVPALRARAATYPLGARDERTRLHHAVAQLLARASGDAPLVLVLDDLHFADADSLGLLDHVARHVARAPWVIVLAYREETEAERARTPLGESIATLRRDATLERIALRGFAPHEVSEYMARRGGAPAHEPLARAVFDETMGNPLFVREMFEHLVEEGALAREPKGDGPMRGGPRGVREVVVRRLGRLRETTLRVLHATAIASEPLDARLLARVTDATEPALLDCLDEATSSGLLRATGDDRYEPSHALVRRVIQDATNPARRAHLARRIAEALESSGGSSATIAACYRASSAMSGAELGVAHAIEAAREANVACAFDRAASFLRDARALAATAPVHVRAEATCELVIAEARALRFDDARAALGEALDVLASMEAPGDEVAAYVAEVARELKDTGAPVAIWEEAIARGSRSRTARAISTWARLTLLGDGVEPLASGAVHVARVLPRDARAVQLARVRGDEDDFASTLHHEPRARADSAKLVRLARKCARPTAALRAFDEATLDLLFLHGAFAEGARVADEMVALAERCGAVDAQAEGLARRASCEAAMGALGRARESRGAAHALASSLGAASRLHAVAMLVAESSLGYFAGTDWRAIAALAARFSADPRRVAPRSRTSRRASPRSPTRRRATRASRARSSSTSRRCSRAATRASTAMARRSTAPRPPRGTSARAT